jgi:predicted enzyme involved in methoxymalonyl-ACP biosynthesis
MSCRVLHRGVEEKLLAKIAAEAEEQSLEQVGQLFGFFGPQRF